ncbi:3'-5' exonuclease [Variovorax sp. Sphag1AA]|uniref:3'-5' exonuclease n=1 Tax=Variovorax sp. Sphag1AA TaxID=2587027 RepID=UPI0018215326|nr:3'-5' exonuclease [Variovorax sp. Sphag1AA]MBB3182399.1 superfamily I DNA/RNA helicase [Variovorax sp. Sphag1AA]
MTSTIKVMTLHASNGLEFPVVAVMGARQPEVGSETGAADDEAREEMRLFYVGATRATSRLIVANAPCQ